MWWFKEKKPVLILEPHPHSTSFSRIGQAFVLSTNPSRRALESALHTNHSSRERFLLANHEERGGACRIRVGDQKYAPLDFSPQIN